MTVISVPDLSTSLSALSPLTLSRGTLRAPSAPHSLGNNVIASVLRPLTARVSETGRPVRAYLRAR